MDPTSFMRQSETIEATTPEISVARTAVASYFSEVKKALEVGQNAGGNPWGKRLGNSEMVEQDGENPVRNGGRRQKTGMNRERCGKNMGKHLENMSENVAKTGKLRFSHHFTVHFPIKTSI